jgi:hypothetical protein
MLPGSYWRASSRMMMVVRSWQKQIRSPIGSWLTAIILRRASPSTANDSALTLPSRSGTSRAGLALVGRSRLRVSRSHRSRTEYAVAGSQTHDVPRPEPMLGQQNCPLESCALGICCLLLNWLRRPCFRRSDSPALRGGHMYSRFNQSESRAGYASIGHYADPAQWIDGIGEWYADAGRQNWRAGL